MYAQNVMKLGKHVVPIYFCFLAVLLVSLSGSIQQLWLPSTRYQTELSDVIQTDTGTIYLAFFGSLPRYKGSLTCPSLLQFDTLVLPSLLKHLIAPNARLGFKFRLFGHTWWWDECFDCGTRRSNVSISSSSENYSALPCGQNLNGALGDMLAKVAVFLPGKVEIATITSEKLPDVRDHEYFAFSSIEQVLSTVDEYIARAHGPEPRSVMLLRWDSMFLVPFLFNGLPSHLLYRANWCRAYGELKVGLSGQSCRRIAQFAHCPGPSDGRGSPDFWMLGNRSTLNTAFRGTAEALLSKTLGSDGCCCMHGHLNYIFSRAQQSGVPLGRYKYHHLDYTFVRSYQLASGKEVFFGDAELLENVLLGKPLWLEQADAGAEPDYFYNYTAPQNNSRCDVPMHFCNWSNKTYTVFRPK